MKTSILAVGGAALLALGALSVSANAEPGYLGGLKAANTSAVQHVGYYEDDWRRDYGPRAWWREREARRWWWWRHRHERREAWRGRERNDDFRYRDERRWR